jgi:4-alpha-glucanotransferase
MSRADEALVALARAHGVEPTYLDVQDVEHAADPDVLRAILEQLEVPTEDPADALRAGAAERWRAPVDPVAVAWDGQGALTVRGPAGSAPSAVLHLEDGEEQALPDPGAPEQEADVDGSRRAEWAVPLDALPHGVHRVLVAGAEATVLAAPRSAPRRPGRAHQWGVFAPLHALRDERDAPLADLRTLAELARWAGDRGADWVATLPLLPGAYDDDPIDASPYRPLTRLAWNELYLDLARLPELGPEEVLPPPADPSIVDWGLVAQQVEGLLTRAVDRLSDRRRAELDHFLAARPELAAYARFRGAGQEARELVHRYAQWALHDQLHELARGLDERGQALYLDLALGVHPDGYDAVAHAASFAGGASVGAPPDDFFAGGQDWGFAPPHPRRARIGGHPYLRACLEHHLGVARMLRLDHVMGLHRLWWIPAGAEASSGAYVRYAADEQYAALTLAATRHGAELIGENLGTVPPEVDAALAEHGLVGMWPLQLAVPAGDHHPPAGSLAVLNTHDMAPFAAWWAEREEAVTAPTALARLLADLGAEPARHVQVSFEDLWLETRPQNVPGTGAEAGNWTRRAARTLGEVADAPEVDATLDGLEAARRTTETLTERSAS